MKSWKTSLCGTLGVVFAGLALIEEMPPLWRKIFAVLATAFPNFGLLFARDNQVTSEDVGVKPKPEPTPTQ